MKPKKNVRSGYLFAIPLILVIVILYSGVLQLILPAVSVKETDYRASEFNYYYFSTYNELTEDETWLLQSGFQPTEKESEQIYQGETTWRDHFIDLAEERLARTAYYYDRGQEEGYTDPEVSRLVELRRAEINEFCELNQIKEDNYYKAYYGSGMSADRYFEQYEKEMYANQYRAYLLAKRAISEEETQRYCTEQHLEEYQTANVYLLTMAAPTDRYTGLVGEEQLAQHQQKLEELTERYTSGEYTFQQLYDAFSTQKTENGTGLYENATHYELPEVIDDWIYQNDVKAGDYAAVMSPEDGVAYLAVFAGWGAPGAQTEAAQALRQSKTDEEEAEALRTLYQVTEHELGLRFSAS